MITTKDDAIEIMNSELEKTQNLYWRHPINKLIRLETNLAATLAGLNRYVKSCQNVGVGIIPQTFEEIIDDGANNCHVWQIVNIDNAPIEKIKQGQRGGSRKTI